MPFHLQGPSNGYYVPGQSVVKNIAQNYAPVKNRQPLRQAYVQTQHQPPRPPTLPHPPKFLSGFKPMDPDTITITQSQEIQVQPSTQRPYDSNSPRPFIVNTEHNSLRPFIEKESPRPYLDRESPRPYIEHDSRRPFIEQTSKRPFLKHEPQQIFIEQESQRPFIKQEPHRAFISIKEEPRTYVTPIPENPRPFVVTVEPNSHPRVPMAEDNSQRPFVQYVTTTLKPQYYTPVSNHIYPSTVSDYNADDGVLNGYDISQVLPTRITSDNLESSIKTLSKLLTILQKANALPQSAKKLTKVKVVQPPAVKYPIKVKPIKQQIVEDFDDEGSTPGKPGVDYPAYTKIPQTSFSCKEQRYKGFFGDPETNCQVRIQIFITEISRLDTDII